MYHLLYPLNRFTFCHRVDLVFRVDLRTNSDYFPEPKRLLPAWRWGVKFLDGNNEVSALCTPLLAVWVVRPRLREDAVIESKEPRH